MNTDFTVGSALSFGWATFKKRPGFFIGASAVIIIVYIAIAVVGLIIDGVLGGTVEEPTLLASLFKAFGGTVLFMGVIAFYLAAHDNPETVSLSALWHPRPFWKFVGVVFLTNFVMIIGFVLLVVPGLIAIVFFMFTNFIVINQALWPIQAMKESMRIGRGYRWPLFGLIVLCWLIIMASTLAFLVGLLVAIPVVMLAFVHAYRVLAAKAGAAPATADPQLGT